MVEPVHHVASTIRKRAASATSSGVPNRLRGILFTYPSFIPVKGPHLAIEAARKAGVPLVLAGTVDRHVRESVDYFEQVITPLIDDQQVTYIGPVDMEQKIDLLSRARGLLNPIQWEEPFGMVMIEAMAVGCPVIAFARGAAPEIVAHGRSGFLVQNVNEMVQGILRIDELDRRAVRAHVEHHFTAQGMAKKYTQVYEKVRASSIGKVYQGRGFSTIVASAPMHTSSEALVLFAPTHLKIHASALVPYQDSQVTSAKGKVNQALHPRE
jgi:glycogen synthase